MCEFDREKNARSRKEKKKRKRKQTNSIARIRARTSPPVVSFQRLKLPHAAKKAIQDIMSRSRDPPSETKTLLTRFQKQTKVKKRVKQLQDKFLYRKIPKISPGAYIFQRLIFGGAYLRFKIDWASL